MWQSGTTFLDEAWMGFPGSDARKVAFLIGGTQKGGTTALAAYLARHPQVFIPSAKEVHFFDHEEYDWNTPNWSLYHQHFENSLPGQIWGEATPITMWWRPAMQRVWQYNQNIRLLIILRNPITRAYSHWNMEQQRGAEDLCFLEALEKEAERCRSALPQQHRVFSYINRGFYSEQLRETWRLFPREQVLVLRQENLAESPDQAWDRVQQFLGLHPIPLASKIHAHQRVYAEPMPIDAHMLLRRIFWHEICELQSLLNWDCSDWLEL